MARLFSGATAAPADALTQPQVDQILADVSKGTNLGVLSRTGDTTTVSDSANDFFFDSDAGNQMYQATAAGQNLSAFTAVNLPGVSSGIIIGESATFAGLPTVENGNYALLSADDGVNLEGVYKGVAGVWTIVDPEKGADDMVKDFGDIALADGLAALADAKPFDRLKNTADGAEYRLKTGGNNQVAADWEVVASATASGTEALENAGTDAAERTWSAVELANTRLNHAAYSQLADGGTAEVGTGRSVAAGATITAPTTRPNGQAVQPGDIFALSLEADGTVTVTGVSETGAFTGIEAQTHAWIRNTANTAWIDLDPQVPAQAFTGADGTNPGTQGDVPAPAAADNVRFLRGDGTWVDLPISPENLIAGPGAPAAGDGQDGDYYQQLDAALGTNDIWGPKAAGAWPAQADFKSAEAPEGTQAELDTGTETAVRDWAPKTLEDWRKSHLPAVIKADTNTADEYKTNIFPAGATPGAQPAPSAAGAHYAQIIGTESSFIFSRDGLAWETVDASSGLFQGPFNAATAYTQYQMVESGGELYMANDAIAASATLPSANLGTTGATWLQASYRDSDWIFSTDGYAIQPGDKIIVQPNHNLTWASTADLEGWEMAPSTGNWSDIAGGTGTITPDAAFTLGSGQNLFFGSDVITAVNSAAASNIILFSGGEDSPSQETRYETVALLPDPTTVASGTGVVVFNDPTATNNGYYVNRGPTSANGLAWVQ